MINPLFLLAAVGIGYYLYSNQSSAASGDATGWKAVDNPKPSTLSELNTYAANATASPGSMAALFKLTKGSTTINATGFIQDVKIVNSKRLWRVTFSSSDPAVTDIAKDTLFVLTDEQLY